MLLEGRLHYLLSYSEIINKSKIILHNPVHDRHSTFFMFSNKVSVFSDLSEIASRPHQGPQLSKLFILGIENSSTSNGQGNHTLHWKHTHNDLQTTREALPIKRYQKFTIHYIRRPNLGHVGVCLRWCYDWKNNWENTSRKPLLWIKAGMMASQARRCGRIWPGVRGYEIYFVCSAEVIKTSL